MDEPYVSDLFLSHAATAVLLHLLNSESAGAVRKQRQSIVDWINDLSEKSIGLRSYLIGDSLSKSNLLVRSHPFTTRPPSFEKIDITLFYDKCESPQHERWFLSLCEALSNHSSSATLYSVPSNEACNRESAMKTGVVDRVTYFPAVRKLEAVIDRTIVSIRPNDVNSLAFALLFEELNALTGGEDLLKRSILLIKAWCFFEAPNIMGKGTVTNSTGEYCNCQNHATRASLSAYVSHNHFNSSNFLSSLICCKCCSAMWRSIWEYDQHTLQRQGNRGNGHVALLLQRTKQTASPSGQKSVQGFTAISVRVFELRLE